MSGRIFSTELKRLMKERGTRQEDLAAAVGVSQGAVSRWLTGSVPKSDKLTKLAAFFSVPMDLLLRGEAWASVKKRYAETEEEVKKMGLPASQENNAFIDLANLRMAELKAEKAEEKLVRVQVALREILEMLEKKG